MEEIRTIEELEGLLKPMVADGWTVAAVALVNSLNREQSNALSVRLVEMLVALPKNDNEARGNQDAVRRPAVQDRGAAGLGSTHAPSK
jgi:hypothetical protein